MELFINLYNDMQDTDIRVLQQDPGIGDSALTGKSPQLPVMTELQLLRAGFVHQLDNPFPSFPSHPVWTKINLYLQATHIARTSRKFRDHPSDMANLL